MLKLTELLGIELPIVQAPMAGAQGGAMAIAVSNAGGLGSLPCAMLTADGLRKELQSITTQTNKPFNVNFFCHEAPGVDAERESAWRAALAPYYEKYGIDSAGIPTGPGRAPFSAEFADVLEEYQPAVVSFHFGLPPAHLLARVKSWRSKIFSSATTVEEAFFATMVGAERDRMQRGAGRAAHAGTGGRPLVVSSGAHFERDVAFRPGAARLSPQRIAAVALSAVAVSDWPLAAV